MNLSFKGKIGRLPKVLREEVNRRLENGEQGVALVAWLNALPEAQALLAAEFKGVPVSEQNLSSWRRHGYQTWLRRREAQAMVAEAADLPVVGDTPLSDQMADWASVHYLMAVRELVESRAAGEPRLKLLREFCRDVVALRRSEHSSVRLQLAQARQKHEPAR